MVNKLSKKTKAIIVSLGALVVGLVLVYWFSADKLALVISVGGSLVASAILMIAMAIFDEKESPNPLDDWGIDKIYPTRAAKNEDSDSTLDKAKRQVDGIAFGLSSFRSKNTDRVKKCLQNGVNFRFLVMHPDSDYAKARAEEEGESPEHIATSIRKLVSWANDLNKMGYPGKIVIKGYWCMTLDFYWRVDDDIYMGPYWYKRLSQTTITYKFKPFGRCFDEYSAYFDRLWTDESMQLLTR